jgi:small subunit ribosomal protein S5
MSEELKSNTTMEQLTAKPNQENSTLMEKPATFDRKNFQGGRNFKDRNRPGTAGNFGGGRFVKRNSRNSRRAKLEDQDEFDSKVIQVKRVTRVVKGGKRMRFAALVVVGDKKGNIGYGLKKGVDFQESVSKATRQAKNNLFKLTLSEEGTFTFPSLVKYKSTSVMLKPAETGTGLISGGFVRPVLELAGVKNCYSKIIGSNNKITGIQAVFEALKQYKD